MRFDVHALQQFYASRLGLEGRNRVQARLSALWPDVRGLDVLGLGYPTPFLDAIAANARRTVAAMPAAQGAETWPGAGPGRVALVDEARLPFMDAIFDRALIVHFIEESAALQQHLREVWRVMAPEGRVVVIAANRLGLWARADATPFGHGRPFSRGQLSALLRAAMLEPTASTFAVHYPPLDWGPALRAAGLIERCGAVLRSPFAGVVMMEAVKRLEIGPVPKRSPLQIARAPARGRLATRAATRTKERP
jgi:SAM-dependent methyltransferase